MAETPLSGNPLGLVADPRYRRMRLGFDYLRAGQSSGYRELTLEVLEGEGEVFYEPGYLPTLGTLQDGVLIIASPCFPRYAPLTLSLRGADLSFLARHGQVIPAGLVDDLDEILRISCTSFLRAARRLRIARRSTPLDEEGSSTLQRLTLTAENVVEPSLNVLETQVIRGSLTGLHCSRVRASDGTSLHDRIFIRRDDDGEIRWRLQCARMEWYFRGGTLSDIAIYSGHGPLATIGFVDLALSGVAIDVSFLDTLS